MKNMKYGEEENAFLFTLFKPFEDYTEIKGVQTMPDDNDKPSWLTDAANNQIKDALLRGGNLMTQIATSLHHVDANEQGQLPAGTSRGRGVE
jgi:hypothetical protein